MLLAAHLHLGAAQTAYVIPAMQQDNPGNHSYKRLSNIFGDDAVLQQYDVIAFTDDYRVNVSVKYISVADRTNCQLSLQCISIDLQRKAAQQPPHPCTSPHIMATSTEQTVQLVL